jgi:hypothetical protein
MSYILTKTDGTTIATVADGQIDTASTSITLVGKNFSGFGQYINENFVQILENFASAGSSPASPLIGQLWYDTTENRIKVYSGTQWRSVGSTALSAARPLDVGTGDFWYNTSDNQLYFFTGLADVLIGPAYSTAQSLSGVKIETIEDSSRRNRTIAAVYVSNSLQGFFSSTEFTTRNQIPNFKDSTGANQTSVKIGFNPINSDVKWHGTASNSDSLGNINSIYFARKDQGNIFTEVLTVSNNGGIRWGDGPQGQLGVDGFGDIYIRNIANNKKFSVKLNKNNSNISFIEIQPYNTFVSGNVDTLELMPGNPSSITTIGGNVTIVGNLDVQGTTTTVESTTLKVDDRNIELANVSGGVSTDAYADGGGLILKGTTNHTILWDNLTDTWNFSENISVNGSNRTISINGIPIIEDTGAGITLTSAVINAPGLSNFGAQIQAVIDNITLNNNRIANNGRTGLYSNNDPAVPTNLEIEPLGDINVIGSNVKIVGIHNTNEDSVGTRQTTESSSLLSSTELSEATNKKYVNNLVRTRNIPLSMDITDIFGGYPTPETVITQTKMASILAQIAPPAEYDPGTIARIATYRYYLENVSSVPVTLGVSGSSASGTVPENKQPPRMYIVRGYWEFQLSAPGGSLTWTQLTPLVEEPNPYDLAISTFDRT